MSPVRLAECMYEHGDAGQVDALHSVDSVDSVDSSQSGAPSLTVPSLHHMSHIQSYGFHTRI